MLPKQGHGRIYINIGGPWGKDFIAIDLIAIDLIAKDLTAKDLIALSTRCPHDNLRLCADRVTIMATMRTLIVGTALSGAWLDALLDALPDSLPAPLSRRPRAKVQSRSK